MCGACTGGEDQPGRQDSLALDVMESHRLPTRSPLVFVAGRKPMAGGGVEEELIPWPNGQVSFLRYAMLGEEAWQDQEAQVGRPMSEESQ